MMMTDETKWGPWIDWSGGECPIPWAKEGDYQFRFGFDDQLNEAPLLPVEFFAWQKGSAINGSNITAFRVRADLMSRLSQPAAPDVVRMAVIDEIAAERRRQINVEGFTAEHDDQWTNGEIADAAAAYALFSSTSRYGRSIGRGPDQAWPWGLDWWKPSTARRDLVKAAALIVAEIERIDRHQNRIDEQ